VTTYVYPTTGDAYKLAGMAWRIEDFVLVSTPAYGGKTRTYEIPGQRLVVTLTYGPQTHEERREIRGWWAKAGQQRNRVSLYDYAAPTPRGTLTGSPRINSVAAVGASSVSVKDMSTGTLKRGDGIGITSGGLTFLYTVTDDATPTAGVATVWIAPPLRVAAAVNDAVAWDKPTGVFMVTAAPEIVFQGSGPHPPFSVSLLEVGE
jgi:hypothetical protein